MHARSAKLHDGARKRAREILWALTVQAVEIGTEPIKNNRPVFMPDRTIGRSIYAHACIRPAEETLCALSTESA